ncbi:vesicle coat component [Mortierella claussenii]|nr:vesicle coat component [Mortierella claussenii]
MTRNLFKATVALSLVVLATSWLQAATAVKFDLPGQDASDPRPVCISHFADEDVKVAVRVKLSPGPHQKVMLEITDDSIHQNQLWRKDNLAEEQRVAFLNKETGDIVACFTNVLSDGYKPDARYSRTVDIEFDIGSETIDYAKLAAQEKLKPMEVELRKLEDLVKDILDNMEHLQAREERMRNTNESTNARVQWFSTMTLCVLVALGAWQIFYLKRFFRKKRLID